MSKFIETLENVGETVSAPLGFGAVYKREKPVQMLLVGVLTLEQLQKQVSTSLAPVHAFLILMDSEEQQIPQSLKDSLGSIPWGIMVNANSVASGMVYGKEAGCEFLVFDAKSTPARVLQDDDIGKVLELEGDIDENKARAIEDLPVDAVVYLAPDDLFPLTVGSLLRLHAVRGLLGKPFILHIGQCPNTYDLISFRDASINGLLVDINELKTERLKELRKAIDELPPQNGRSNVAGP